MTNQSLPPSAGSQAAPGVLTAAVAPTSAVGPIAPMAVPAGGTVPVAAAAAPAAAVPGTAAGTMVAPAPAAGVQVLPAAARVVEESHSANN